MFKRLYIIILLVALAAVSCSKEPAGAPEPSRLLVVYMGVDNNLVPYCQDKLEGLRDGWTGKPTDRIIAYVDKRGEGATLYELSVPSHSDHYILATFGAQNSASATTLGDVIDRIVREYPAENRGLLVFSHGSGWLPEGALYNPTKLNALFSSQSDVDRTDETAAGSSATSWARSVEPRGGSSTRSIIIDGTSEMSLAAFAAAIPSGVFDYIVFEACFMAGIEVAYELRDKATYILASSAEIVNPGFSPIYARLTDKLLNGNVTSFGRAAFDHTLTYAENDVNHSATYSVIRTDGLNALADFIRQNCDLTKEIDVTTVQRFDRNSYRLFFDFEDYHGRLLSSDAQRAELSRLIDGCIAWKDATDTFMTQSAGYNGFVIEKHSGLTTYIPQAAFTGLNAEYRRLGWTQAAHPD